MAESATAIVGSKVSVKSPKSWPTTSSVVYTSDKTDIATVDSSTGEVTGVKTGEATITATLVCGEKTVVKTTKVSVKNYDLQSVKQTKGNTVEAVVAGNTKNIKAADVKITNKTNHNNIVVKSVSVDAADATKVTFETFADMKDGAAYTVELDGLTAEFTATDGVVADVNVTPVQIPANTTGTDIYGQTLDKNGIVIEEFTTKTRPTGVDFTLTTTQGYVNDTKLVLPVVGNTGVADITYHTYKYDAQANEVGAVNKKITITAVEDVPATIDGFKYTVTNSVNAPNWNNFTVNNQFSVSDNSAYAHFNFVDSKKSDVTSQYTVVSSDNSVLLLPATPLSGNKYVPVVGIKAGNAYINVMKDNKVVTSLPVVVTAERKLSNITLNPSAIVTISKDAGITEGIEVKAFDQYGWESVVAANEIRTEVLAGGTEAGRAKLKLTSANGKVTVDAKGVDAGRYTVKIEVTRNNVTQARTITVNVVSTEGVSNTELRLVLSASEVDMAVADDATATNAAKSITAQVVEYAQGAKIGVVSGASFELNGKKENITENNGIATISVSSVSGSAITKNLVAGSTYTVKATVTDTTTKTFSGSFTVKDTQAAASARVNKVATNASFTAATAGDVQNVLRDCVTISYNNKEYKDDIVVTDASGARLNTNSIYVGTVKVRVENGNGVSYDVPVVINTTFTR